MLACPVVGQRVVFYAKHHNGDSESTWQDAEVIETAKTESGWTVKVRYRAWGVFRRSWWQYRWVNSDRVMALVNDGGDAKELERLYKL